MIMPHPQGTPFSAASLWQERGIGQASSTPSGPTALILHGPAAQLTLESTATPEANCHSLHHNQKIPLTNLPPVGPIAASKETTPHLPKSKLGQSKESVTCWIGFKLTSLRKTAILAFSIWKANSSPPFVHARHNPRKDTSLRWSTPTTKHAFFACAKCFATLQSSPSTPIQKSQQPSLCVTSTTPNGKHTSPTMHVFLRTLMFPPPYKMTSLTASVSLPSTHRIPNTSTPAMSSP